MVYIFFRKRLEIAQLDEKSETGKPPTGIWLDKLGIVKLIHKAVFLTNFYNLVQIQNHFSMKITSNLSESNRILNFLATIAVF